MHNLFDSFCSKSLCKVFRLSTLASPTSIRKHLWSCNLLCEFSVKIKRDSEWCICLLKYKIISFPCFNNFRSHYSSSRVCIFIDSENAFTQSRFMIYVCGNAVKNFEGENWKYEKVRRVSVRGWKCGDIYEIFPALQPSISTSGVGMFSL